MIKRRAWQPKIENLIVIKTNKITPSKKENPEGPPITELRLARKLEKEMEQEERKKKVRKSDVAELRLPI